jgi:hypothetical protein
LALISVSCVDARHEWTETSAKSIQLGDAVEGQDTDIVSAVRSVAVARAVDLRARRWALIRSDAAA